MRVSMHRLCVSSAMARFGIAIMLPAVTAFGCDRALHKGGQTTAEKTAGGAGDQCVACHEKQSPGIVQQWASSRHAAAGMGCLVCHAADQSEVDAWKHQGVWISSLVTPKDCGTCHSAEYKEFTRSHNAKAGEIIASLDNVLA